MALEALDARHAAQIEAGTKGRKRGHSFESLVAQRVNQLSMPFKRSEKATNGLVRGDVGPILLNLVLHDLRLPTVTRAAAVSAGALATAEAGTDKELVIDGIPVKKCKSDVVLILETGSRQLVSGVSIKQCSNPRPTNAQLYFTTARAFCELLKANGIKVSEAAVEVLRMFCGDPGFRPFDNHESLKGRLVDPRRWFWEELPDRGRKELERILAKNQDQITRLLLQKAYTDDPFPPNYLIHQTCAIRDGQPEFAIYSVEDFIRLSSEYGGFALRPYRVNKGSYRDPPGIEHLGPRFGIIQMQRGGQSQHPTQLQFNLKAGYFYQQPFSNPTAG
jgi:hypothetical protein